MSRARYIGLISGTSRDGVDAALVSFADDAPELEAALCLPYPPALAAELDLLIRSGKRPHPAAKRELDARVAAHFGDAVFQLLEKASVGHADITAIGSHGQTVWHQPDGPAPVSVQLGDPQEIARKTGVVTVGDFRRADIEAGGQGAPLAPLLHRELFVTSPTETTGSRIVLNLGGIANVSILGGKETVSGFDTGPANCLLDAWISRHLEKPFDRDGRWSSGGAVDPDLLRAMLADSWFARPAPKSTGVEYFNLSWVEGYLRNRSTGVRDVQATLAELAASSIAAAISPFAVNDVLVCGGGVHNGDLLQRLRNHLPGIPVRSTTDMGLDPDWIEAVLFAWLARERLAGRAQDTRRITGARRPVLLGSIHQPGPAR